jgi:poly(A) polymerase
MFMDPFTGEILDHVGGRADLERGLIRAIGEPAARFAEDRLRLLRAIRFASTLDFEIEEATSRAVREQAEAIRVISRERIRDEILKILTGGGAARGFRLLASHGLLEVVLPDVAAMAGVEQPPEFHPEGDVWEHTLEVLAGLDRMEDPSPTLALAALLHDVGKPPTFSVTDRIRFNDHARIGAQMAEAIARDLRLSRAQIERVTSLVRQHMTFLEVRHMRPGRLRRFLAQEDAEEHLELHRLDCEASHGSLRNYEHCRETLEAMRREPQPPPRLLTGHDLIAQGFAPGPLFARILKDVEEAQLEHRISTPEDARRFVRERYAPDDGVPDDDVRPPDGRDERGPGSAGGRGPRRS